MSNDIRILNPRRCGNRGYRKRILILTEGETEEFYFRIFFVKKNSSVRVIPIHVTDHSANNAISVCRSKAESYSIDISKGDRLILILDVDRNDADSISEAEKSLCKDGYELYLSNPSFEYWLVLHFMNTKKYSTQDDLEDLLSSSKCLGYKYVKGSDICKHIDVDMIDKAIKRAECNNHSDTITECAKNNPSTTLYKLIEDLRSL